MVRPLLIFMLLSLAFWGGGAVRARVGLHDGEEDELVDEESLATMFEAEDEDEAGGASLADITAEEQDAEETEEMVNTTVKDATGGGWKTELYKFWEAIASISGAPHEMKEGKISTLFKKKFITRVGRYGTKSGGISLRKKPKGWKGDSASCQTADPKLRDCKNFLEKLRTKIPRFAKAMTYYESTEAGEYEVPVVRTTKRRKATWNALKVPGTYGFRGQGGVSGKSDKRCNFYIIRYTMTDKQEELKGLQKMKTDSEWWVFAVVSKNADSSFMNVEFPGAHVGYKQVGGNA